MLNTSVFISVAKSCLSPFDDSFWSELTPSQVAAISVSLAHAPVAYSDGIITPEKYFDHPVNFPKNLLENLFNSFERGNGPAAGLCGDPIGIQPTLLDFDPAKELPDNFTTRTQTRQTRLAELIAPIPLKPAKQPKRRSADPHDHLPASVVKNIKWTAAPPTNNVGDLGSSWEET